MGAQFTEGEGKRRLNRIWNDKASSKENARRLREDIEKLKGEMKAKEQAFKEAGFNVTGKEAPTGNKKPWSGLPAGKAEQFKTLPKGEQSRALKGLLERYDVSIEQLKKDLGL